MNVNIQWYPGHMLKAKKEIIAKLKLIDVIIEMVDARLPRSSKNPMLDEIISNKPRLIILNKADLADQKITEQWISYYQKQNQSALTVNSKSGKNINKIPGECTKLVANMISKRLEKGMNTRSIRALIAGIPNVGKSSLINRLANKNVTNTGDRPGITRHNQWIKVKKQFELLDTPGILWPKFDDQQIGYRLAATGAIKDTIFDLQEVALFVINFLNNHYSDRIQKRYQLADTAADPIRVLEEIAKKRGCFHSGGKLDYDKASLLLLRELRSGHLGTISFEAP